MCVNLQVQGMWDTFEHDDDIEERKDGMILAAIYQAVLEELMLAEKDSAKTAWEMLQTMRVDVELVEEAKV